jgi:prepilin-type N-terminal cleavage/methylation domain-containing protein
MQILQAKSTWHDPCLNGGERMRSMVRRNAGLTLIELLIALTVIGVLAAMAYTSYQDHRRRAWLAESLGLAAGAKQAVETFYGVHHHWPHSNAEAELAEPQAWRSVVLKSLAIVQHGGEAAIELTLSDKIQDNANAWLIPGVTSAGGLYWQCVADSTIQRLLPDSCQQE